MSRTPSPPHTPLEPFPLLPGTTTEPPPRIELPLGVSLREFRAADKQQPRRERRKRIKGDASARAKNGIMQAAAVVATASVKGDGIVAGSSKGKSDKAKDASGKSTKATPAKPTSTTPTILSKPPRARTRPAQPFPPTRVLSTGSTTAALPFPPTASRATIHPLTHYATRDPEAQRSTRGPRWQFEINPHKKLRYHLQGRFFVCGSIGLGVLLVAIVLAAVLVKLYFEPLRKRRQGVE